MLDTIIYIPTILAFAFITLLVMILLFIVIYVSHKVYVNVYDNLPIVSSLFSHTEIEMAQRSTIAISKPIAANLNDDETNGRKAKTVFRLENSEGFDDQRGTKEFEIARSAMAQSNSNLSNISRASTASSVPSSETLFSSLRAEFQFDTEAESIEVMDIDMNMMDAQTEMKAIETLASVQSELTTKPSISKVPNELTANVGEHSGFDVRLPILPISTTTQTTIINYATKQTSTTTLAVRPHLSAKHVKLELGTSSQSTMHPNEHFTRHHIKYYDELSAIPYGEIMEPCSCQNPIDVDTDEKVRVLRKRLNQFIDDALHKHRMQGRPLSMRSRASSLKSKGETQW